MSFLVVELGLVTFCLMKLEFKFLSVRGRITAVPDHQAVGWICAVMRFPFSL